MAKSPLFIEEILPYSVRIRPILCVFLIIVHQYQKHINISSIMNTLWTLILDSFRVLAIVFRYSNNPFYFISFSLYLSLSLFLSLATSPSLICIGLQTRSIDSMQHWLINNWSKCDASTAARGSVLTFDHLCHAQVFVQKTRAKTFEILLSKPTSPKKTT